MFLFVTLFLLPDYNHGLISDENSSSSHPHDYLYLKLGGHLLSLFSREDGRGASFYIFASSLGIQRFYYLYPRWWVLYHAHSKQELDLLWR